MKTIFLSFLLSITLFAQSNLLLLMGDDGYAIQNFELEDYNNSLTTKLSNTQLELLDTYITMVKDSMSVDSLADFADVGLIFANETSESGLKNIVKRSNDADIAAATVTFTKYEGFVGDATGYIHLDYNPSTDADNYLIGSASIGVYCRTDDDDGFDIGVNNGTAATELFRTTNNFAFKINADLSNTATTSTDGRGMFIASRTSSILTTPYVNSVAGTTTSETQRTLVNLDFFILGRNLSGSLDGVSNRQLSAIWITRGLDATEVRKLTNCTEVYMDALGKGVIP